MPTHEPSILVLIAAKNEMSEEVDNALFASQLTHLGRSRNGPMSQVTIWR